MEAVKNDHASYHEPVSLILPFLLHEKPTALHLEALTPKHQLQVLKRSRRGRVRRTAADQRNVRQLDRVPALFYAARQK